MSGPGARVNWSVFDGFRRPYEQQPRSWVTVDAWRATIDVQFAPRRETVRALRAVWDQHLRHFGGDPHARDWSKFRALRRHREEDWSDWLAQLVEDSATGNFAWRLLGMLEGRSSSADYVASDVMREVPCDAVRADLVILWRDASYTHIEVKVGDESLEKTHETSLRMQDHFYGIASRRSDILLLLPEQRTAWAAACERNTNLNGRIRVCTWVDVARSLRGSLLDEGESPVWQAWAYAFDGAIEQELLGVKYRPDPEQWVKGLSLSALDTSNRLLATGKGC